MILCKDRVDRTGFLAQKLVGLLSRTIHVDDSVHALLEYSRAAIPHVCAVVVVAEEDRPGGVFPGADCKIVRAKDLPSMFVPLGPICRAGHNSRIRNDNGFAGKGCMNLVEIVCGVRCPNLAPTFPKYSLASIKSISPATSRSGVLSKEFEA